MKDDTLHQSAVADVRGAILEERMNTLIGDMKELKESSRQLVTLLVDLTKVQGDIQATTKDVSTLTVTVNQVKKDNEAIGRHVAVVSLWGKIAHGLMAITLGAVGWSLSTVVPAIRSFDDVGRRVTSLETIVPAIRSFDDVGRRVTSLETIVNAKALENTFDPPVVSDSPQSTPSGGRRR